MSRKTVNFSVSKYMYFDTLILSMLKSQYQQHFQAIFTKRAHKVFNKIELQKLFEEQKSQLRIRSYNLTKFINLLIQLSILKECHFKFSTNGTTQEKTRYLFDTPDNYELIYGLGKSPYFSFETALFYHGLLNKEPKVNSVTIEQSLKKNVVKVLKQDRIDLAFTQEPRFPNTIGSFGKVKWLIHNGMFTGNTGMCDFGPNPSVKITGLERTILDITVRSTFFGGPEKVLEFYKKVKGKMSVDILLTLLKQINYTYPYHQSIGFYLQAAGYDSNEYKAFKEIPMLYDFYLDYAMESPDYSEHWKVYYPCDLI